MGILKQEPIDISLAFDRQATSVRTHQFLVNDFQHWMMLSGISKYDLRSPQLDEQLNSRYKSNGQEERVFRIEMATTKVKAIYTAISHCRADHELLLRLRYVDDLYDQQVMNQLGVEKTQYYHHRNAALCEFAERLDYWSIMLKAELPSLIVSGK